MRARYINSLTFVLFCSLHIEIRNDQHPTLLKRQSPASVGAIGALQFWSFQGQPLS